MATKKTVDKAVSDAKTTEKKTKAPSVKKSIVVQYGEKETFVDDLYKKIKEEYEEMGAPQGAIKKADIYIKPEENMAYYVINGVGDENFKIQL
ncbi:MAG: hypothetical protein IJO13_05340 [Lachnospiraceae bacterium]|nr:hypothetical protein [Lachnospiraceae bacterium]